jgi:outer membrane protein OmpA-like peptidoglycan-associated protein
MNRIQNLENRKNWKDLYPVLRAYVKNFGIENFYKDTYWVWRLAKLTEEMGNHDEALLLYRLVLKHHREDIDITKVELHYDSLIANDKDYFVPIDYYYELVEFRKEVDTLRPPRGVLINMGKDINSETSDYAPSLNMADKMLIFTSKRKVINPGMGEEPNEDLFFSINDDGYWRPAQSFPDLNTLYNEGSACMSKDGKTLYFSRCYSPESYGNCDIFVAKMQFDGKWSDVANMGPNINSLAWDSHPSLNHTEDTLYFASDRIGGFGLADIYFTYKDANGRWMPAKNAGPIVNSRANEISPFFHHKDEILYFSSNGHAVNFGAFDIYKTQRVRSSWSEPKNIGPLVNGSGNEFYFTIDSESRNLYYSHSTEKDVNNLDLYSFPVPMEAQPGATTTLEGSLNDGSDEPFKGIVSIIDMDNGIEVAPKFLRPDGTFEFNLINNNNYLLIIRGEEFLKIEELFFLDGNTEFLQTTENIKSTIEFESIQFGNEESNINGSMFGDLNKVGEFLLDNPEFTLKISGHTDSDGREEFNLELSQKRADAIKEYLVYFNSVEPERIISEGYGSSKPLVKEVTDADKGINRRVEFQLVKGGG